MITRCSTASTGACAPRRQLEDLQSVPLQAEGAPDPLHRRDRHARGTRHTARTRVGCVRRQAFKRAHDHGFDTASSTIRGAPERGWSRSPSIRCPAKHSRHLATVASSIPRAVVVLVLGVLRAPQHSARRQRQRFRRLAPRREQGQLKALCPAQHHLDRTATSHPMMLPQLQTDHHTANAKVHSETHELPVRNFSSLSVWNVVC